MAKKKLVPVILLFTDNAAYVNFFRLHFTPTFVLHHTDDPEEILETLKLALVDLLILDQKFKGVNILDLSSQIRKKRGCQNLPMLLISQSLKKAYAKTALGKGINDFINPPLDFDEVKERISSVMKDQDVKKRISKLSTTLTPSSEQKEMKSHLFTSVLNETALKAVSQTISEKKPLSLLKIEVNTHPLNKPEQKELKEKMIPLIKESIRASDLFFPQENCSFIVILPRTTRRASHLITEEIEKSLKPFKYPITFGFGYLEGKEEKEKNAFVCLEKLLEEASHTRGIDLLA